MQAKNEVFCFHFCHILSVLSLFSAEAAMLMLEMGGLCFQKIRDWQSAPDAELVFAGFSVDAGHVDTSLLLYICVVSLRELVPMPFGASSLSRLFVTVFFISGFLSG